MIELFVNIKGREKSYPIHINNNDLDKLKNAILEEIHYKNYIVVISQKVHKLYSKILDFPKDKIFILKDGEKKF